MRMICKMYYIYGILIFILIVFCLYISVIVKRFLNSLNKNLNRLFLFKRHDDVLAHYEQSKIMAFDVIKYNDLARLQTSSLKNTEEEISEARNKFIKIVIQELMSGDTREDIINIKGDLDSVMNDLSIYFNIRIIDEDVKTTENKIENGDIVENIDF